MDTLVTSIKTPTQKSHGLITTAELELRSQMLSVNPKQRSNSIFTDLLPMHPIRQEELSSSDGTLNFDQAQSSKTGETEKVVIRHGTLEHDQSGESEVNGADYNIKVVFKETLKADFEADFDTRQSKI